MRRRRVAGLFVACLSVLLAADAWAGAAGVSDSGGKAAAPAKSQAKKNNEPALLTADEVTSDESLGLVIARGHVELSQSGRTVQADIITYNQKSKVVIAAGSVRLFEPGGDVMFSDYAELTDDMRTAFINNVRMIMTDNARATGTEAERTEGRYTRMNHATYSPCYLCAGHPDEPPVWQLRGTKAVHDNVDKDVRYTDAVLEVLDVPVLYLPYFSHPDPTVKRRSGFLTPMAGRNSLLGVFVRDAYYFDIAPEMDATFEPTVYTNSGPMLGGEVRRRFETGYARLSGDIIYADKWNTTTAATSARGAKQDLRGYLAGNALFDINDAWRWGGEYNYASDRYFLRQFAGDNSNMLTSRGYVEGFYGRDYASVKAYRFQDLRVGNAQLSPTVAPLGQYSMVGEPNSALGGRWSLDSGIVGLTRSPVGTDSTRMSIEPGWSRQLVSDTGLVTTLTARARADVWNFRDFQGTGAGPGVTPVAGLRTTQGSVARVVPAGQAKFAYPLVRNGEVSQQTIEPLVAVTAAPVIRYKKSAFPNEDSQDVELDETSLFNFSRFVGQDRQEGGQRVTYGLHTGTFGFNQGSGSVFVGQDYRLSNDRPYDVGTGLANQRSDYVGRVDVAPAPWLYMNYRGNYDAQTLLPRREAVSAAAGVPKLMVSSGYHFDRDTVDPVTQSLHREEYVTLGASSQVSRYWTASVAHSQAIAPDPGPRNTRVAFTYTDECMIFQALTNLDFTSLPGSGPSQSVYFRVVFKNLGEFTSPGFNPMGLFSPSSATTSSSTGR